MSFHLRITSQQQFPWVKVVCTQLAEELPASEAGPSDGKVTYEHAADYERTSKTVTTLTRKKAAK